ncbi:transmembrane ascorbate-dependent reductase CYB561 isoform X2 [Bemisia tabaci]|uniref:transmembrane ascorbate-dependent reductase CYB561 isoform X2 n=1 Tax=Bemisia tabaci TaxID=7038 RepID=UPI0008F988BB|nr:PREDICTED: cytochrome b561 isoform X2 [Bemisia tabaci]XP_018895791.1 PREDICTED: cytochrome b561 isoform X2 [Bemisia tabaci]
MYPANMDNSEMRNIPANNGGGTGGQQGTSMSLEDLRGFRILLTCAQVVGGILVLLVAIWTISYRGGFAWRSNPGLEFNWHPLLMTIGMIYLYGNGILMYRTLRNMRKRSLKITHASVLFAAFALSSIGIIAAFDSHNLADPPKPNLYTLHSWFGIITFTGFTLQWVGGLVTFLYPGLASHIRAAALPVHMYFGLVLFIMACTSAVLGLAEKAIWTLGAQYASYVNEGLLMNQIGLLIFLFAFIVIYLVTHLPYKRQPRPEDENLLTGLSD